MNIEPGQRTTRSMTVDEGVVNAFAEITGDYNPLHFDAEFASKSRFGALIAQGGIATGLLHALVAMDLPGPGSVFVRQSWKFPRPVYIGDTIRAEAVVRSVQPKRGIAEMEFRVTNQDAHVVLEGEALVYQAAAKG
jgi:acyl dehydratase